MDVDEFIARHRGELEQEHGWELRFAGEVFARVNGLDFANVRHQTEVVDDAGRPL